MYEKHSDWNAVDGKKILQKLVQKYKLDLIGYETSKIWMFSIIVKIILIIVKVNFVSLNSSKWNSYASVLSFSILMSSLMQILIVVVYIQIYDLILQKCVQLTKNVGLKLLSVK